MLISVLGYVASSSMLSLVNINPMKWFEADTWGWDLSGLAEVEASFPRPSASERGQALSSWGVSLQGEGVKKEAPKMTLPNLLQAWPLLCIALAIVCNAVKLDLSTCEEPSA